VLYFRHRIGANVKIPLAAALAPILSSQPFTPSWASWFTKTPMQTILRNCQGTSPAYRADGHAIALERCLAVAFPVVPGMVDTN